MDVAERVRIGNPRYSRLPVGGTCGEVIGSEIDIGLGPRAVGGQHASQKLLLPLLGSMEANFTAALFGRRHELADGVEERADGVVVAFNATLEVFRFVSREL